jgi:hypothetical protein
MKKVAAFFAACLTSACVTVQYPEQKQDPTVQYAVFQLDQNGKMTSGEPTIKNSHFPLFPPVNDEACDESCKRACLYLYKHDDYKYHDCIRTQTYWLTPVHKPRSLADSY